MKLQFKRPDFPDEKLYYRRFQAACNDFIKKNTEAEGHCEINYNATGDHKLVIPINRYPKACKRTLWGLFFIIESLESVTVSCFDNNDAILISPSHSWEHSCFELVDYFKE